MLGRRESLMKADYKNWMPKGMIACSCQSGSQHGCVLKVQRFLWGGNRLWDL